jgi:hypothetical protein
VHGNGRGLHFRYLCLRKILTRIFGSNSSKVTGGCRELHKEDLHNLNSC